MVTFSHMTNKNSAAGSKYFMLISISYHIFCSGKRLPIPAARPYLSVYSKWPPRAVNWGQSDTHTVKWRHWYMFSHSTEVSLIHTPSNGDTQSTEVKWRNWCIHTVNWGQFDTHTVKWRHWYTNELRSDWYTYCQMEILIYTQSTEVKLIHTSSTDDFQLIWLCNSQ